MRFGSPPSGDIITGCGTPLTDTCREPLLGRTTRLERGPPCVQVFRGCVLSTQLICLSMSSCPDVFPLPPILQARFGRSGRMRITSNEDRLTMHRRQLLPDSLSHQRRATALMFTSDTSRVTGFLHEASRQILSRRPLPLSKSGKGAPTGIVIIDNGFLGDL